MAVKGRRVFLLAVFANLCLAGAALSETIRLSQSADIADADLLYDSIAAASRKVTECIDRKLAPPEECSCRYPQELQQIHQRYDQLLEKHPAWRDQTIFWTRKERPDFGYNIAMKALRLQVEMGCPAR